MITEQPFTCFLCSFQYRDPKLLNCLHTFCKQCLIDTVPPASAAITCPICEQQTILPENEFDGLQDNLLVQTQFDLKTIAEEGEFELSAARDSFNSFDSGTVTESEDKPMKCLIHSQFLEFYCLTCEQVLCSLCRETLHTGHDYTYLENEILKQKSKLEDTMRMNVETEKEWVKVLEDTQTTLTTLKDEHAKCYDEISNTFQQIINTLCEREKKLKESLDQIFVQKREILLNQIFELKQKLRSVNEITELNRLALNEDASYMDVLLATREVAKAKLQPTVLYPMENDYCNSHFEAQSLNKFEKLISNFGSIDSNSALFSTSTVQSQAFQQSLVNAENLVAVTLLDRNKELVLLDSESPIPVTAAIVTESNRKYPISSIRKCKDKIHITFILSEAGNYRLEILVNKKEVTGSPFLIKCSNKVRSKSANEAKKSTLKPKRIKSSPATFPKREVMKDDFILQIGEKGAEDGCLISPFSVYVNSKSEIICTDPGKQRIQKFTHLGQFLFAFGTRGRASGYLQKPSGIALTPKGMYVICDSENHCITVFNEQGEFVQRIRSQNLKGPKGVAISSKNELIVTCSKTSLIQKYNFSGQLISEWSIKQEKEKSSTPSFLTLDTYDNIYVSDAHNCCVKVFDDMGNFMKTIGCGTLKCPSGIAVDTKNNTLVCDWINGEIKVFDSEDKLSHTVCSSNHPLSAPQGLALSNIYGHVLVADSGNHCLKSFQYIQS